MTPGGNGEFTPRDRRIKQLEDEVGMLRGKLEAAEAKAEERIAAETAAKAEEERNRQKLLKLKTDSLDAMTNAGIHKKFVDDSHLTMMWNKHFEHNAGDVPSLTTPLTRSYEGANLRILQWNILAEGLVPEGFLMPLVSKEHVAKLDAYLAKLIASAPEHEQSEHLVNKLSNRGHRSSVCKYDADGNTEKWVTFARMAITMVDRMKGLHKDEKEAKGKELKKEFNSGSDEKIDDGQLTVNENAVVAPEHRLLRVLWMVSLMEPDIIALQECDNFTFFQRRVGKNGLCMWTRRRRSIYAYQGPS